MTATAQGMAPDHDLPDRRYMEPPSESLATANTQQDVRLDVFGNPLSRNPIPSHKPAAVGGAAADHRGYDGRYARTPPRSGGDDPPRPSPYAQETEQPRMPNPPRQSPYAVTDDISRAPRTPGLPPARPDPYATTTEEDPRRAAPQREHLFSSNAPESWRNAARSMAERGRPPTSSAGAVRGPGGGRPGGGRDDIPAQGLRGGGGGGGFNPPSLRLKLDGQVDDDYEHHKSVPKSRLPVMLLALLLLLAAAGGGTYWASEHGGLAAVAQHLLAAPEPQAAPEPSAAPEGSPPAATTTDPPGSPGTAQPAGTAPQTPASPTATGGATQPPASAAPSAAAARATEKAPFNPANSPVDQDKAARELAEPEMPETEGKATPAAADAKPEPRPASESKPKPAAARAAPARKGAPRAVPRREPREPVVKIQELDPNAPPPEPRDMPYVPVPFEPPAPDEPR